MTRRIRLLGVAVALAAAAAYGLRVGLIEPEAFGHLCAGGEGPWWCGLRGALIGTLHSGAVGVGAVALGAVATFQRQVGVAVAAVMLGVAGLVLYDAEPGAVALLLGGLVLGRTPAGEPRDEYGPAEQ